MARLAGSIELLVGPSTKGFWKKAEGELRRNVPKLDIQVNPGTKRASAELDAWRKRQEANAVNLKVNVDSRQLKAFQKDFKQVEHIFTQSASKKAIRINIAVVGATALPALAQGALSATTALTELGQAALVLPGVFSGLAASVGTLIVGLSGLGDAFKAAGDAGKVTAKDISAAEKAARAVASAQRDVTKATRDAARAIEDQGQAMRDTYLDKAQAAINVERARLELLKKSGKSQLDQREDQVRYLQALSDQARVTRESTRTIQDGTQAMVDGVKGSDRYLDATDRLSSAIDTFTEAQKKANGISDKFIEAMNNLGPAAQDFVTKILSIKSAWTDLQKSVSDSLLSGIGDAVVTLANKRLPLLKAAMTNVATSFNGLFKSALANLGSDRNAGFIERIFSNTATAIKNATPGLNSFVNGFLQLSEVGARFLPRLGDAFTTLGDKFAAFIDRADKDGSLVRWIDRGLNVIDQLGSAIGSIGSILNSLTEAYEKATGNFGGLASTISGSLGKLAKYLSGPDGQQALVGYIQKAQGFIDTLKKNLPDILKGIGAFVEGMRTFGQVSFPILAGIGRFLQDNIGLVKAFVSAFLVIRTVKPFLNGIERVWSRIAAHMDKVRGRQEAINKLTDELNETQEKGRRLEQQIRAESLSTRQADAARVRQEQTKLIQTQNQALNATNRRKLANIDLIKTQAAVAELVEREQKAQEKLNRRVAKVGPDAAPADRYAQQYQRELDTATRNRAEGYNVLNQAIDRNQEAIRAVGATDEQVKNQQQKYFQARQGFNSRTVQGYKTLNTAQQSVRAEVGRLTSAINTLQQNAFQRLSQRITGGGGVKGALQGLAGMMGTVVSAIGGVAASAGLMYALYKLADQHQKAGDRAEYQRSREEALANQLDQTTGAVTRAGVNDALRAGQKFQVTVADNKKQDVNAVAAANQAGIPTQQLAQSFDPTQTAVLGQNRNTLNTLTLQAVREGKDKQWTGAQGALLRTYGIDDVTYAAAVNGEPAAHDKVDAAIKQIRNDKGVHNPFGEPIVPSGFLPDLGTAAQNLLPSTPSVAAAQFLNQTVTGNQRAGQDINQLAQNAQLKPGTPFDGAVDIRLGPDGQSVSLRMNKLTPEQISTIQESTSATPTLLGAAAPGQPSDVAWQLTGEALHKYVQGFKHGGPVKGRGSGDTVPAMLEPGEHVFTKSDVAAMGGQGGVGQFRQHLALGGQVMAPLPFKRPPAPFIGPTATPSAPGGFGGLLGGPKPGGLAAAKGSVQGNLYEGKTYLPRGQALARETPRSGWFGQSVKPTIAGPSFPPLVSPYLSPGTISRTHGEGLDTPRTAGNYTSGYLGGLGLPQTPSYPIGPANRVQRATPSVPTGPGLPHVTNTPGKGNLIDGYHWEGNTPVKDGQTTHGSGGAPGQSQVHTGGQSLPGPSPHTGTGVPTLPGPVSASVPTSSGPVTATASVTPGGQVVVNTSGSGALPDSKSSARSAVANAPIIPNANITDYLKSVAEASGLRVGAGSSDPDYAAAHGTGVHSADGAQHQFNRALDIGNIDQAQSGQISQFVKDWMSDPTKVASTRQLIFRGPEGDYGIINGRVLSGSELQSVYGGDLGDHTDHVHLALEGVPADAVGPDGLPLAIPGGGGVTLGPDGSTIQAAPGLPFAPIGAPAGALGDAQQGNGFSFDFGNGDINGPFGKVPFNPIDFSKQIGGILLQMVGGFFGLDFSQITGTANSIISGLNGGQGGEGDASAEALGDIDGNIAGYDSGNVPVDAEGNPIQSSYNGQLPTLSGNSGPEDVAKYIVGKGKQLGYSNTQIQAILSTALQESGLNPSASGGGGAWKGIFQQDSGYPGRDDPKQNIDAFFTRLGSKGGKSGDIWKNIFWLQQAPGRASADAAFAGGRQNYLTEIQSQAGRAQGLMAQLGFAGGGGVRGPGGPRDDRIPAMLSNGEFVVQAPAAKALGPAALYRMNNAHKGGAGARAKGGQHLDGGGFPFIPQIPIPGLNSGPAPAAQMPIAPPPGATPPGTPSGAMPGSTSAAAGPPPIMPTGPMAPPPPDQGPAAGLAGVGLPSSGPVGAGPQPMGSNDPTVPGGGGEGGVEADPNAANSDIAGGIEQALGGVGAPTGQSQPGAEGAPGGNDDKDPRATLGAQPASTQHLHPGLKAGIEGAAQTVGSIASMAASAAITAGTFGAGGPAAGAAASGIQAGAQIAGAAASGAANILASLAVGNVTGGTTGQGYGAPLLPQQPGQTPVRSFQAIHNGDVVTQDMDQYTQRQKRMQAQQSGAFMNRMPI